MQSAAFSALSAFRSRHILGARFKSVTAASAQVLHLYENFTYAAHPPMIHDYQLSATTFDVKPGAQGVPARQAAAAVPPCSRGRWVLGEEYRCRPCWAPHQSSLVDK